MLGVLLEVAGIPPGSVERYRTMSSEPRKSQPRVQSAFTPKDTAQDTSPPLPPLGLGRALRTAIRDIWDRLGLVIAISLTWILLFSLVLTLAKLLPVSLSPFLRLGTLLLLSTLFLSAPLAGAFWVAHRVCVHDEVGYLDFWRGTLALFGPATRLGLLLMLEGSMLGVNFWFYLSISHPIGRVAMLLCLYTLLFWGMIAVYQFPLLVVQEEGVFDDPERRAKRGVLAVQRRAVFLVLGNLGFSLGLFVVVLLLTFLFTMAAIPLALFWAGAISLLTTQATRTLLIKYEILPPPPVVETLRDEDFRIS